VCLAKGGGEGKGKRVLPAGKEKEPRCDNRRKGKRRASIRQKEKKKPLNLRLETGGGKKEKKGLGATGLIAPKKGRGKKRGLPVVHALRGEKGGGGRGEGRKKS